MSSSSGSGGGGEVVCCGWLRKSPPEKKLKRYAWKKRWFILRSGRLTGDPDVLEYYKNDHTKKPIRIIDLNLCEQVDAGLTFNKKEFENSFIFDIKTIDRIFYLVADTEEEMNKWVRCICEICGFNPTEEDVMKPPGFPLQPPVDLPPAVGTAEPCVQGVANFGTLPPPYQMINLPILEPSSSQSDPPDYLLLINCRSTKLQTTRSHADSVKSTSSETDCNDNVPSHKHTVPPASKHTVNGFFQQQSVYDSPPVRAGSVDSSLYHLPRSYSQDASPKTSPSELDAEGELYTFNVPTMSSVEGQMRHCSLSYDIPPTPGGTYQIPRTYPEGSLSPSKLEPILDVPPPRPPKPSYSSERSPVDTYCTTRTSSETDSNYCIPTSGMPASHSNTISTVDLNRWRKDMSSVTSDDFYNIPRTFSGDRSSSLEGFQSSFKNRSMLTIGSISSEDLDENYVPMNPNSPPRHHSSSFTEPIQETNYVPMTPGSFDMSAFGMQVPPPVHMGFRPSPNTPQKRVVPVSDCEPPPVDRNLKPHRKGQSPKTLRPKPHGLERTDSQTIGEFPSRRKVRPAPLEIKPLSEWEEMQMQTPIRSPVTRSFTRDSSRFPMPSRPESVHSTASSSDSLDSEENYVPMNPNLATEEQNLFGGSSLDGGSSPMVKPKGDKQVEYLDLDLESGKSTPPRKSKNHGSGSSGADERVDYVVVDQQKTQALKSTREAWKDGRQSTETETPTKSMK
ncbi:GRB2-associated-binding protein 1 isoform X1 [Lissotriton helveticus]